jgi:hypothetical protein
MKRLIIILALLTGIALSAASAQDAGRAGAFARLGFGARGIGMGNAMTAVTTGEVSTYYNPAVSAFSQERYAEATFSILSLDRSLNFLSYTQAIKPTAGISAGLINAGVKNIDGRDADGIHTDDYSTFENQFYLAFSNRLEDHLSLGVAIKLYYSKLFDQVKSTTVGFDIGACAKITPELSLGLVVQDINSKYKWDTKSVYGEQGHQTEDPFPTLRRIGLAYAIPSGVLSLEFENSSEKTNMVRLGAEYTLMEYFTLRTGVDRWDLGDEATGSKLSFGFTVRKPLPTWTPAISYGFVVEPFAPQGMHLITLSAAL